MRHRRVPRVYEIAQPLPRGVEHVQDVLDTTQTINLLPHQALEQVDAIAVVLILSVPRVQPIRRQVHIREIRGMCTLNPSIHLRGR